MWRYLLAPGEKILPKRFAWNGVAERGKIVILQTGVEERAFEAEWRP